MKKSLSILLALLCLFSLPLAMYASAADTQSLTLTLPEERTEDDLWLVYDEDEYPDLSALTKGEAFIFTLGIGEKYDPYYTNIYANGALLEPMPDGNYVIYMEDDVEITCPLFDGTNFRLKTFNVSNPSADGYRVRPPAAMGFTNYKVQWGGEYTFRVILLEGYKGAYIEDDYENSRLVVRVKYTTIVDGVLTEVTLNVGDEGFEFVGTDTDGSPLFKLTNITHDMDVVVSSLQSDTFDSVISWMKRILRLILNLFTDGGGTDLSDFFDLFGGLFDGFAI